jgi:signal transduction histidine kinase
MAPDKVLFKYQLEGLERDWKEAGTKRLVQYNYLRPGDYTFRVMACNNDEVWNREGASLAFTVLPYFWQTWWFEAGALAAGAGAVAAGVLWVARRRLRRKLEHSQRQHALERERARIARDIHDDLGASLTRITLLSQSARSELPSEHRAATDLDTIYGTARELTRAMDEIVWAVNPRHDSLDSLVTYVGRFAQNFLSPVGLRCRLDVPMNLPAWTLTAEIRHNLFLAVKEALHNVMKHARATEVRISLELLADGFVLVVADNGQGFDPSALAASAAVAGDNPRLAPGNGLFNMRKRLEEAGGRCEWHTAPQEGTRVRLTVNVEHAK